MRGEGTPPSQFIYQRGREGGRERQMVVHARPGDGATVIVIR